MEKRYICQPLPKRNRDWHYRDVVQLARTPALGAGGRTFESYHPDKRYREVSDTLN